MNLERKNGDILLQSLFFVKDLLTASASCLFVAAENALGQIKKHINTVAVVLEALTNIIIQTNCIPCKNITNKTTHTQTFNCILFELLIQGGRLSAHIHLWLMIPFVISV